MRSRLDTAGLRSRVRAWALRRQGQDVLPLQLAARRIYILPTPAGWMFALLLAVMFMAGMNYGNGLALLFTFWLVGFALVAMVQTQRGLAGTRLLGAIAQPAHAGDSVRLSVTVSGRNPAADLTLEVDARDAPGASRTPADQAGAGTSRDATDSSTDNGILQLDIPVRRRGRWRSPPLLLASTAPFGLFRTWTWLQLDVATLVYPRAAGARQPPESAGEQGGSQHRMQGHDDFAWLRDFREGDSPRQVAWKAYARGQPLLVREYHGEGARQQEFDYETLHGLDVEARLSQLTRWILDASAREQAWVLRLPGSPPLAGEGPAHLSECLARLALFDTRGTPRGTEPAPA